MNKKLLFILPVAMLLAACGGGGKKPASTNYIYGKTFAYKGAYFERTEESDKWLTEHMDEIDWDNGKVGARIAYWDEDKYKSKAIDEPDDVDELWDDIILKCYEDIENELSVLTNTVLTFDEYKADGTSGTATMLDEKGDILCSGPIVVTDVDGAKHGEAVSYEGTMTGEEGGESVENSISGTLKVGKVTDDKIVYTDVEMAIAALTNESINLKNDIKLIFPLKSGNEDYEILGRANLLPVEE